MEQKQIFKGVFGLHRSAFESGFNALAALQDQDEHVMNDFLEKAAWVPQEGKDAIIEWFGVCRMGRRVVKDAVNDGYKKVEAFLISGIKVQ